MAWDLWLFPYNTVLNATSGDSYQWDGSSWVAQSITVDHTFFRSWGQFSVRHFRDRYMSPDGTQMLAGHASDVAGYYYIMKWDPSDNSIRDWLVTPTTPSGVGVGAPRVADIALDIASPGAVYFPTFHERQIFHRNAGSSNFTGFDPSASSSDFWYFVGQPWPGWNGTGVTADQWTTGLPASNYFAISPSYSFYHNGQWYCMADSNSTIAKFSSGSIGSNIFGALFTAPSMGQPAPATVTLVKLVKLFANTTGFRDQEIYPHTPVKWNGHMFLPWAKVSQDGTFVTGDDLVWLYMLDSGGTLHDAHSLASFWDVGRGEDSAAGLGVYFHQMANTLYAFVATGHHLSTAGNTGSTIANRLHVLRLDSYSGGTFTWTEVSYHDEVTSFNISYDLAVTCDDTSLFIGWTFETAGRIYQLNLDTVSWTVHDVGFGANTVMFLRAGTPDVKRSRLYMNG